ncbi:MAG: hypothetical protein JSU86_06340, partial [Phycisphaerales bacterium]
DNTTQPYETQRNCLACGYNLFGLGSEPRCPECGLLNIPSGFRQQVWDLVDSGTWFFSGLFTPFRRRLPGWWWALDRPGDVRRPFRCAAAYLALSACLIFGTGAITDAIRLEVKNRWSYYRLQQSDRARSIVVEEETTDVYGLSWRPRRSDYRALPTRYGVDRTYRPNTVTTVSALFEPSLAFLDVCGVLFLWVFWIWAGPALVGLHTQIRTGLPKFARAPRTIIAASVYELHRLPYLAAVIAAWMVVEAAVRMAVLPWNTQLVSILWLALPIIMVLYGVGGWIGPLRSDYTRQLVRSRVHAVRIVIMYVLVLPLAMTGSVVAAHALLLDF